MLRVASIFCSLSLLFLNAAFFLLFRWSLSLILSRSLFPFFTLLVHSPFLPLYLSQYPIHTFFFFLFSYSFLPTTFYLTMFLSFCLPLPPTSFLSLPLSLCLSFSLSFSLSLTQYAREFNVLYLSMGLERLTVTFTNILKIGNKKKTRKEEK